MFCQKNLFLASYFKKKAYILAYFRINNWGVHMHYEEEEEEWEDQEENEYWRDDE